MIRNTDPCTVVVTDSDLNGESKATNNNKKPLTLIPLIFLIYFEVSGGPYGEELAVKAAGPLLAILGFLIFPLIWSIPEALVTAELSTAFPGDGGYVVWADAAFGPFWGSLMGSWKYLSGIINAAAYPVLMADYLARAIPKLFSAHHRFSRCLAIITSTLGLSFFNYLGLAVVGYGVVAIGVISLVPFLLMVGLSVPKLQLKRWKMTLNKNDIDWRLYINTLFWNLNFWDNASTLAGEVDNPKKTFPRALLASGFLTCLGYILPLMAATGGLDVSMVDWEDGFLADAAGIIGGNWLKIWVSAGSVLSVIGLYEAQMSSCVYQLVGMADLGLMPKIFSRRSPRFHTPWVGILVSTLIILCISFLDFTDIIMAANFIYSLSMLLEFAAFLWLRRSMPELERPYRIPLRLPWLVVMCLVPAAFIVAVMCIGSLKVYAIGVGLTLFGIVLYFNVKWYNNPQRSLTAI